LAGTLATVIAKPAQVVLSSSTANSDCTSGDENCTPFVAAGESFSLTAQAQCRGGVVATDYRGEINLTHAVSSPAGGGNGVLGASSVAISNAGQNTINQSISEVGVFTLSTSASNYFGKNVTEYDLSNLGRFYPASFNLVLPVVPGDAVTENCGAFSYMGQDNLALNFDIEARNSVGDVTRNYRGDFAKATVSLVAEDNNDGGDYGARLLSFAQLIASDWDSGAFGVLAISNDVGNFSRGLAVDGPYADLQLGLQLADNDGNLTALAGLNMNAAQSDNCTTSANCDAALLDDTEVRFGVLHLDNAFGPEEFDLDVNVSSRYFDGSRFITTSDDNCSVLDIIDYSAIAGSWTGNLDAADTAPTLLSNIVTGNGQFRFDKAGNGNDGSVQFEYAAPPWLQTENDGDGDYQDDPFSTITFGQFRGTDRIIYWRENVNR